MVGPHDWRGVGYHYCNHHSHKPTEKETMKRLLTALSQESTWRGIIAISAACGIQAKPELAEAIITVALALIGTINVAKNK